METLEKIGIAAAGAGWRNAAAKRLAPAAAGRTRFRDAQVRAVLGLVFLAVSVRYLTGTARRFLELRG